MIALDLLQTGRGLSDIRKVEIGSKERHRPGPCDHRDLRIRVLGHAPVDVLIVTWAELKTLPFPARVPDQVGQKCAGVVVAQGGPVAERPIQCRLPFGIIHLVRRKEMTMHTAFVARANQTSKFSKSSEKPWNME